MVDDWRKVGRSVQLHGPDGVLIGVHHAANPGTERVRGIAILKHTRVRAGDFG